MDIEVDFDSPLDGDGHGSHTAAIVAGNNGIPVQVQGFEFGKASGMAPRARIVVYKALYRMFRGFVTDVVAAIDQVWLISNQVKDMNLQNSCRRIGGVFTGRPCGCSNNRQKTTTTPWLMNNKKIRNAAKKPSTLMAELIGFHNPGL